MDKKLIVYVVTAAMRNPERGLASRNSGAAPGTWPVPTADHMWANERDPRPAQAHN